MCFFFEVRKKGFMDVIVIVDEVVLFIFIYGFIVGFGGFNRY